MIITILTATNEAMSKSAMADPPRGLDASQRPRSGAGPRLPGERLALLLSSSLLSRPLSLSLSPSLALSPSLFLPLSSSLSLPPSLSPSPSLSSSRSLSLSNDDSDN